MTTERIVAAAVRVVDMLDGVSVQNPQMLDLLDAVTKHRSQYGGLAMPTEPTRFEQEMYTGGMAVVPDGEWVRYDAVQDLLSQARAEVLEDVAERVRGAAVLTPGQRKYVLALLSTDRETT